jgi:hypothetical protein
MANTLKIGKHSLTNHGVLMIGLGTALCALGSLMARPMREQIGYALAAALTAICLLIACISLGIRENRIIPQRLAAIYLMAGASSIVCCLVFWLIQSASIDLRVLGVLAGLVGLFWGFCYMRLAFQFQTSSIKAPILCAMAATTSSIGIILATRSGLSKLSSVTSVGCYMTLLGVQIYLTAAFLHREYVEARVIDGQ